MTGEKKRFLKNSVLIIDILLIVNAFNFAYIIRNTIYAPEYGYIHDISQAYWVLALFCVLIPLSMELFKAYERLFDSNHIQMLIYSALVIAVNVIFVAAIFFVLGIKDFSRLFFGWFSVLTAAAILLERILVKSCLNIHMRNKKNQVNVLVVGTNSLAERYTLFVRNNKATMVNIVGYLKAGEGHYNIRNNILGEIADLESVLKSHIIDEVVFALPKDYYGDIQDYVLLCEEKGLTVNMMLELFDIKVSKTRIGTIGDIPMVSFYTTSANEFQLFLKRVLDIVGAAVGLMITGIAFLFVAPAILIESPGPVFFSQMRMGKNGRAFKCYKFRSMFPDAEKRKKELLKHNEMKGNMFKMKNDPRITRVGKFIRATSIDELPQFWNVLMGDMSLVGTRPPTLDEVAHYENHHWKRLSMKPGITGLWQTSGRNSIADFEEVIKLDKAYIENWSLSMDIQLLIKTVKTVIIRAGAS